MSCICLTKNRRVWLPQAIDCFLSQTYENRELVVVADGDPVHDLIPPDPRIRLILPDDIGGWTIGTKRNYACMQAAGPLIAHWDDDDHYHHERLALQVKLLLQHDVAVTGVDRAIFRNDETGERFLYNGHGKHVIGASLMFQKHWWKRHPFEAKQIEEETEFYRAARAEKELWVSSETWLIEPSIHSGNTSPRETVGPNWSRVAD